MPDSKLNQLPEHQSEAWTEIQSLILAGNFAEAKNKWDNTMEEEFMRGVAWEQDEDNGRTINYEDLD